MAAADHAAVPQEGTELASRKPQYGAVVGQRLGELRALWDGLHAAAEEKGRQLFEANRAELCAQSYGDLERWLGQAEGELRAAERAEDLTSANLMLKRLTVSSGRAVGEHPKRVLWAVWLGPDGSPPPAAGGASGSAAGGAGGAGGPARRGCAGA